MRFHHVALSLLALCMTTHAEEALPDAPSAFFAGNEELNAYLLEAIENHPLLRAHFEDWQAALARVPQAGALEDPKLSYRQFVITDETYFMLSVEQSFPWFGTRSVRREKAAAEAEYWLAHLHEQRNAVFREVKSAYFEYAFLMEQLRIVGDQAGSMGESVEIARAQFEAGWSSEVEILRVDQELARMLDMRRELEQMEPSSRAALNAALGRPQDAPINAPQAAAFPTEPPEAAAIDAAIQKHNPVLRMFDHTIDAEQKDVDLARRKNYPDITLGVDYAVDRNGRGARTDPYSPGRLQTYLDVGSIAAGREALRGGTLIDVYDSFAYKETDRGASDELTVTIGVNLPIWRKRIRAGIAEKEHMANASRWHREDELRMLAREARESRFQWDDAARRTTLYRDELIPREQGILEGLQAEYARGSQEISILEMLDSMRNVMQFQLEGLRAEMDRHLAATNIEYLLGAPWSTPPLVEANPLAPPTPEIQAQPSE